MTSLPTNYITHIHRLVGDVLLATAFLSYSGPFNQEFRDLLLNGWKKEMRKNNIPFSEELNVTSMMVDNATISEWNLQGKIHVFVVVVVIIITLSSLEHIFTNKNN